MDNNETTHTFSDYTSLLGNAFIQTKLLVMLIPKVKCGDVTADLYITGS